MLRLQPEILNILPFGIRTHGIGQDIRPRNGAQNMDRLPIGTDLHGVRLHLGQRRQMDTVCVQNIPFLRNQPLIRRKPLDGIHRTGASARIGQRSDLLSDLDRLVGRGGMAVGFLSVLRFDDTARFPGFSPHPAKHVPTDRISASQCRRAPESRSFH